MNILVVGGGGREHVICWKLSQEKNVEKIYCAPGNAGIKKVAECVDIKDVDIKGIKDFAVKNKIDLVVVGPEAPLVIGLTDELEAEGIKVFGPDKSCSRLEGSKSFSKHFMEKYDIPTAKYSEYTDIEKAKKEIDEFGYPVVIKADGLAAGKGVIIAKDKSEALEALDMIMGDKKFGDAGNTVVIEEFLEGIETSILAFVDNDTIIPMVSAKDHKKIFENETGPNTGGMGTFSPSPIYDERLEKVVREDVLDRTLDGFKKEGLKYKGILFVGLMITKDGEKVLEYNCRFGDPETQSVLMRLETDLSEIMLAAVDNRLKDMEIKYKEDGACCVILASKGYPESSHKGDVITGLDKMDDGVVVFHSGTAIDDNGEVVTNGGRVLGVTSLGATSEEAAKKVYKNIEKIHFDGMQYRKDIGVKYNAQ